MDLSFCHMISVFTHSIYALLCLTCSYDETTWVSFEHSCVHVLVFMHVVVKVLFSRFAQRIVKESYDAVGYLQPRLLQKPNCHTQRNVSGKKYEKNMQQPKPHAWLRKKQQLCGNRKCKVTTAAANWGIWLISWKVVRATMSLQKAKRQTTTYSKKKKKTPTTFGQTDKQAWILAWHKQKGALSPVVIQ